MKTLILCEGTTDLLLLQFILQLKYGWKYKGFIENSESNQLQKKILVKDDDIVEINSCGGINKIPKYVSKVKEKITYATKNIELYNKIIILIDHDDLESNKTFISQMNVESEVHFGEENICKWIKWNIENEVLGKIEIDFYIKCVPEEEIGSIEDIMLDALNTDSVENDLITSSRTFINEMSNKQKRYIQKKSKICKAIFNTYFAIRTPEEKYDERARILNAFDWRNNDILNTQFNFLDV